MDRSWISTPRSKEMDPASAHLRTINAFHVVINEQSCVGVYQKPIFITVMQNGFQHPVFLAVPFDNRVFEKLLYPEGAQRCP